MRGAVFADAGTLFGYDAGTNFSNIAPYTYCPPPSVSQSNWRKQPTCLSVLDSNQIRSSVGASLLWQSPLGPIRFDLAYPITKAYGDRTQIFRFTGGTSF
jgi:outer membrane protein insertion porin family